MQPAVHTGQRVPRIVEVPPHTSVHVPFNLGQIGRADVVTALQMDADHEVPPLWPRAELVAHLGAHAAGPGPGHARAATAAVAWLVLERVPQRLPPVAAHLHSPGTAT